MIGASPIDSSSSSSSAGSVASARAMREHLLLAARQRAGDLLAPLPQPRELRERPGPRRRRTSVPRVGRHPQVLAHREVREDAPALGDQAHAGAGERVGRGAVDVAAARAMQLPAGRRRSGPLHTASVVVLPAPFGPSSATTWPGATREVDAVQHVDACRSRRGCRAARGRRRRADRLDGGHGAVRPRCRGTRRSTFGSAWISAGVPLAMMRPKSSTWMYAHVPSRAACRARRAGRRGRRPRARAAGAPSCVGLVLVVTRRRLVEQQHLRLRRERAAQLDEPRGARSAAMSTCGRRPRLSPTRSRSSSATVAGSYLLVAQRAAHLERRRGRSRAPRGCRTARAAGTCGRCRAGPAGAGSSVVMSVPSSTHPALRSAAAAR